MSNIHIKLSFVQVEILKENLLFAIYSQSCEQQWNQEKLQANKIPDVAITLWTIQVSSDHVGEK